MKVPSGTKEFVHFREADETYKYTDIELEARVCCISIVTDYDKEKYNSGKFCSNCGNPKQ